MDVSENRGFSPQIIHFNRVFHYFHHPFWGFSHYFWKHIYDKCQNVEVFCSIRCAKASSMASLAPWLIQPYAEVSNTVGQVKTNLLMQLGLARFQDCMFYVCLSNVQEDTYYHIHLSFHRFKWFLLGFRFYASCRVEPLGQARRFRWIVKELAATCHAQTRWDVSHHGLGGRIWCCDVSCIPSQSLTPRPWKMMGLEDKPLLFGWYIFRGYLKFPGGYSFYIQIDWVRWI